MPRKGSRATIKQTTMNQKKTGFTLLELLIVIAILAVLVVLALPFYQDYINKSRLVAAETDLQTFQKALALYDHCERKIFGKDDNLRDLIGTYLQDYRVFDDQIEPIDPWGNDYVIDATAGVILSRGPNGEFDSKDTIAAREASGDDLLVTWKPDFFVSAASRINNKTLEIEFSRKIQVDTLIPDPVPATFTEYIRLATGSVDITDVRRIQRVSDTIFRIITRTETIPLSGTVIVEADVASQDGRRLSESRRPADGPRPPDNDGSTANRAEF